MAIQKKNIPNSPRLLEFKQKQKQARKRKLILFSALFVSILIGLVALSRWNRVNIHDVNISGSKVIEASVVEKVVSEDLSGYYLWLIPKSNFIFYPKQKILQDLESNFKRLKDVSVSILGDNTLEVSVVERHALYTWCGVERPIVQSNEEKCYFLDDVGYVFDDAPIFSGDVYFRLYGTGDAIDTQNPLGSYYFKKDFARLVAVKKNAYDIGLQPVSLAVVGDEVQLYLKANKNISNPVILLKKDADIDKVSENLHTALSTDPLKTKFNTKYAQLRYVDLRFGNKVYFKFGDSAPTQANNDTASTPPTDTEPVRAPVTEPIQ